MRQPIARVLEYPSLGILGCNELFLAWIKLLSKVAANPKSRTETVAGVLSPHSQRSKYSISYHRNWSGTRSQRVVTYKIYLCGNFKRHLRDIQINIITQKIM